MLKRKKKQDAHVTPAACGRMIGLSDTTVRRHIEQGIIPAIRVPRAEGQSIRDTYRVPMEWIDRVLANKVEFQKDFAEATGRKGK